MAEWVQASIGEILEQADSGNLRQKAEEWLSQNPQVFALFERFAMQMVDRQRRFGMRLLAERIRWEMMITTVGDEEFKLNDHHTPYIARKLVEKHPVVAEFIEMRRVKF